MEVGGRPPDDNHKLTEQDEPYEIYVAVTDATRSTIACVKTAILAHDASSQQSPSIIWCK